jgi:hypothetical protein
MCVGVMGCVWGWGWGWRYVGQDVCKPLAGLHAAPAPAPTLTMVSRWKSYSKRLSCRLSTGGMSTNLTPLRASCKQGGGGSGGSRWPAQARACAACCQAVCQPPGHEGSARAACSPLRGCSALRALRPGQASRVQQPPAPACSSCAQAYNGPAHEVQTARWAGLGWAALGWAGPSSGSTRRPPCASGPHLQPVPLRLVLVLPLQHLLLRVLVERGVPAPSGSAAAAACDELHLQPLPDAAFRAAGTGGGRGRIRRTLRQRRSAYRLRPLRAPPPTGC